LVSNGSDAISKLKKYYIKVVVDKEKKTLQIIDNGIGMTGEEVKKYINQIAFSGIKDFVEKYKDKGEEAQIIGHFGLGFYSAFMVSSKVQIDTLSYQKGAQAVRWISTSGIEYEMEDSDRTERGTTVTLYIAEDSEEFLDFYKVRETLVKYFSFLPYEIKKEGGDNEEKKAEEPKPINDTNPLWLKNPKDCTEQEYKDFYKKVFFDFKT